MPDDRTDADDHMPVLPASDLSAIAWAKARSIVPTVRRVELVLTYDDADGVELRSSISLPRPPAEGGMRGQALEFVSRQPAGAWTAVKAVAGQLDTDPRGGGFKRLMKSLTTPDGPFESDGAGSVRMRGAEKKAPSGPQKRPHQGHTAGGETE